MCATRATPAFTVLRSPWRSPETTTRRSRTPIISSVGSRRTRPSSMTGWRAARNLSTNTIPTFFTSIGGSASPHSSPIFKRFAAYYYDEAARRHQGVVLTYKGYDFPENAAVLDIERGKLDTLRLLAVANRYFGQHSFLGLRKQRRVPHRQVTHRRIRRRGQQERQPAPQRRTEIRRHYSRRGARHSACKWARGSRSTARQSTARARGSSTVKGRQKSASSAKNSDQQEFTSEDIRFTTNNGALYAIALGWPANSEMRIRSLAQRLALPQRSCLRSHNAGFQRDDFLAAESRRTAHQNARAAPRRARIYIPDNGTTRARPSLRQLKIQCRLGLPGPQVAELLAIRLRDRC